MVRDGNVSLHVSLSDTNTAVIRCSSSQRKPHVPLVVPSATAIFTVLEGCQEISLFSPHSLILKGSTVVLLLSTQNNVYVKILYKRRRRLGQYLGSDSDIYLVSYTSLGAGRCFVSALFVT